MPATWTRRYGSLALTLSLCALTLPAPAGASGFSLSGQGVKALGMGGAFTAQANDPTAVFYNPGGLALLEKGKLTAGTASMYLNESQYRGTSPGPGAGTSAEQEAGFTTIPVHTYAVKKLGDHFKLGAGLYQPYGFENQWTDPASFAGRTLTTDSELQVFDVSSVLAWKVTPSFGLGAGAVYRNSKLSTGRRIQALNPTTAERVDIGSLAFETDNDAGFGWTAGLLHRIGTRFSWGISYRSPIEIDFQGSGTLTQVLTGDDQFDALNVLVYPYDTELPASTTLTFPDEAVLGIAFAPSERFLVALDVAQTGWSQFEGLAVTYPANDSFDQTLQGVYDDTLSYRLGLQVGIGKGMQLRFGYALEESPQPDPSVAPFFPDAERSVFSLGFGRDWLDVGFQFITPDDRTTLTNADTFNGTYSGNTYILGISATKK
jgi:long-chain fatty acid transport protein